MRIQDIADIIIMTFLLYQLYTWFRKTRALQVVIGLGSLVILYIVTKNLGLFMTSWILQELGTVIFVLIIVVFQGEIRQALYRFSMMRNFFGSNAPILPLNLPELAATIFSLAASRTGALIVFERQEKIDDQLLHGVQLDSLVSGQLIASIFEEGLPLHDGAVIIRNGRITEASCHLPLSSSGDIPQHLGTRHRAAVGMAERSDAIVVVVSEERGVVSLVSGGELVEVLTPEMLVSMLKEKLEVFAPKVAGFSVRQRLFNNFIPKLVTLLIVLATWLVINAREAGLQTVRAPVKFHGLPANLVLKADAPEDVEVQLKVLSTLLGKTGKLEVAADLDLSGIREGVNNISLDSRTFQLPLGVSIVRVTPAVLKVVAERKGYRELPVHLRKSGRIQRGVQLRSIMLEPSSVTVTGPVSELSRLRYVETEPLDLSAVGRSQTIEIKLVQPSPQIQVSGKEPVRVRISTSLR